jgi:KUP system potassium uptake protein
LGVFLKTGGVCRIRAVRIGFYVPLNPVADLTPAVQVSCADLSKNHASAAKSASALLNRAPRQKLRRCDVGCVVLEKRTPDAVTDSFLIISLCFPDARHCIVHSCSLNFGNCMSQHSGRESMAALTLGALGVVYGDIGTSPLYTMKEVFSPATGVPLDATHLIGAVSVIFWGLMMVVTLKYVLLILRADNRGEGGIMALTALAAKAAGDTGQRRLILLLTGVFGASLFYGDSIITPAISVLSAVEGLEVVSMGFKPYVLPISIAVLIALFAVQRYGTAVVGKLFGPVIVIWFAVLAVAGISEIMLQPAILAALNPLNAIRFLSSQGWHIFIVIGAIVLAFTGAEALYADMGHFGKRPIQLAWTGMVLPALAINYMGQGALLMRDPSAIENPFFRLFPEHLLIPAVVLATIATVIASQAVISGAYSMTKQAVQLGLLPRMQVNFTSAKEMGQIYMPGVNWLLLAGVLFAVVGFGSSSAMAAAYGIAVTVTMMITTILTFFVIHHGWKMPFALAVTATGVFLTWMFCWSSRVR